MSRYFWLISSSSFLRPGISHSYGAQVSCRDKWYWEIKIWLLKGVHFYRLSIGFIWFHFLVDRDKRKHNKNTSWVHSYFWFKFSIIWLLIHFLDPVIFLFSLVLKILVLNIINMIICFIMCICACFWVYSCWFVLEMFIFTCLKMFNDMWITS